MEGGWSANPLQRRSSGGGAIADVGYDGYDAIEAFALKRPEVLPRGAGCDATVVPSLQQLHPHIPTHAHQYSVTNMAWSQLVGGCSTSGRARINQYPSLQAAAVELRVRSRCLWEPPQASKVCRGHDMTCA